MDKLLALALRTLVLNFFADFLATFISLQICSWRVVKAFEASEKNVFISYKGNSSLRLSFECFSKAILILSFEETRVEHNSR